MTATAVPRNPRSAAHPQTKDRFAHFGQAVRRHRKALGLSQDALARRAGCERQSVNRVENGAYSPSLDRCYRLADALGVRLEELLHEASVSLTEQRKRDRADD
jgi:putative transcriptional regulator